LFFFFPVPRGNYTAHWAAWTDPATRTSAYSHFSLAYKDLTNTTKWQRYHFELPFSPAAIHLTGQTMQIELPACKNIVIQLDDRVSEMLLQGVAPKDDGGFAAKDNKQETSY